MAVGERDAAAALAESTHAGEATECAVETPAHSSPPCTEVRVCGAAGCNGPGAKLCTRCGSEAYCSAECQRKAWKVHKTVCKPAETPESAIGELLRAGKLFSAKTRLAQLPKPSAALEAELEEKIKVGVHSEIVENRIQLVPVEGFEKGYVAATDLCPGDVLLFDTAFAWAPADGAKEFHFVIADKCVRKGRSGARRTSSRADQQADFYYNQIQALELKAGLHREWLEGSLDDDQKEQVIVCGIAEGNSIYCTEDLGHFALFPAMARFNHSCAPNASFETTRTTALVRADVAIRCGEEVTISYLPREMLQDAASRRSRLKGGRGFDCICKRCVDEGHPPVDDA
eukprot:TRINITY_DN57569_c0_g1_i1.p1 TRINITY_DN57569_c0_g1~~TRINITY_DN57569_c0_g1_i1.p1  ORF type:complete len:359 (-),score=65.66 TRINITY_DN57569_c0_g1_i1:395-1423(-)